MVAIRFLERSAFDTLARLVDPRGGYILLSTFIEEERETPRKTVGDGGGDESTGGGVGSSGVGREKEGGSPRFAAVRVGGTSRKNNKHGSTAATLEAAIAAATLARWPHASPRDYKKILRRGELARYFGDRHGFEVLEDSVARLPDGRPVACFLARRVSEKLYTTLESQGGRGMGTGVAPSCCFLATGPLLVWGCIFCFVLVPFSRAQRDFCGNNKSVWTPDCPEAVAEACLCTYTKNSTSGVDSGTWLFVPDTVVVFEHLL